MTPAVYGERADWAAPPAGVTVVIAGAWFAACAATLLMGRCMYASEFGPGMGIVEAIVRPETPRAVLELYGTSLCLTSDCAASWHPDWSALTASSLAGVAAMWLVMAVAMMLPTALPMIRAYRTLSARSGRNGAGSLWVMVAGYLTVWSLFALAATALQAAASRAGLMSEGMISTSPGLTASLLILAGLYQFTPSKTHCIGKCRAPARELTHNWRPGLAGSYRMGLRQGEHCLCSCWALMLLTVSAGTMNLVWMLLATALMLTEKLPRLGPFLSPRLGAGLLAAGGGALGLTLMAPG